MRQFLIRTLYNRSYVLDIFVGLLLVTTIFFLVGQRNLTYEVQRVTDQNKALNQQTIALAHRIQDCTDPAGTCYKDNTARSEGVVADINRTAIVSALCAKKIEVLTVAEMQKCISDAEKTH